jgi:lipopolysaccharide biosynthesis regulator YciM
MVQGSSLDAIVKQRRAAELLVAVAARLGSQQSRAEAASAFGRLSGYYLLQRQPNDAVDAAQKGLALDSSQARIKLNLAHGLLYSGRLAEAERVYRQNSKATLNSEQRFDEEALAELRDFIVRGIVPPEMSRVEDWLKPGR